MISLTPATARAVSAKAKATATATTTNAFGVGVRTISTRITDLFGCEHPILLPGMSWISTPPLVAAVSNAGGLGILATGPLSEDETRASIREIRKLTNKPFGVGATLLMPGAAENARVALEEEVPFLNVSLGKADWIRDGLDAYGGKLLATVTNKKHAGAAIASGADALMATGHEAAAHGGDVTSLVLVPSLAQEFPEIPLVAAGGFATGRGLNAALVLGADAVAMGTRLAVTNESPLAEAMKDAIVRANEAETIYGKNFDGIPARVLQSPTASRLMESRPWLPVVVGRALVAAKQMGIPLWKVLPGLLTRWNQMFAVAQFGAATQAIKAATVRGDSEHGVQFVGQCQGMIHDIPTVDVLIQRILEESMTAHQEQVTKIESSNNRNGGKRTAV
jgi:enoyl-[acyl-carrier protein] reductase II